MALREELQKQGDWCFRWRSYWPLPILPILLIALQNSGSIERLAGNLADDLWEGLCIAISFAGFAVRCITTGCVPEETSGGNTKRQIAKTLNTTGTYSIVRHPLYLGNFIIVYGITLFVQVWWFTLIVILAFWLYYERIILAEEDFLAERFGTLYVKWAEKTPAFLPKFRMWQRPSLPFSPRTVIREQYSTLFAIISSFTFLEVVGDIFVERKLALDPAWAIFFIIGLTTYLVLTTLKKKTQILDVNGR